MSQVVDLGYVVGPTGPKGDDATLPSTTKVTVYVGAFISSATSLQFRHEFTYVSDREVKTISVAGNVDGDGNSINLDNLTQLEVDYGSVVVARSYNVSTNEQEGNMLYYFDPSDLQHEILDNDHRKSPRVYLYKAEAFVCVCPVAAVAVVLR